MKARVKATGEIVEVHTHDDADFQDRQGRFYWEHQLYFGTLDDFDKDEPDYWEKLKHQYAGMAMQGIMMNEKMQYDLFKAFGKDESLDITISDFAIDIANTLVEKLKEEHNNN